MAKNVQCERCDAFIKECGLYREEWEFVEFNDADSPLFAI